MLPIMRSGRFITKRRITSSSSSFQTLAPAIRCSCNSHRCRSYTTIPDNIADMVQEYTKKKQTSASLQTLMKTGRGELLNKTYKEEAKELSHQMASERILMQVASFIRKEMPIRLAHRIQDLDQVPFMRDMPSVQTVKGTYVQTFLELLEQPKITTPEDEQQFAETLEQIYLRHGNVLIQMAKGAFELREAVRSGEIETPHRRLDFSQMKDTQAFLDRFYLSRIGMRVLAGQYLALRGEPLPNYIGMICSKTSPCEIVQAAAADATMMCERKYGVAPDLEINGRLDLTFPYMPTHLHYILLELLKNAMRATVEQHGVDADDYPPVGVIIADGTANEDVVIKVTDEGGGIPRSQMDKIWSYLFTTADPSVQEGFIADHSAESPIAGLGYGLPISRSYARYFGGDIDLMSMEGYGTDAFVYLRRLGNSREPLPLYDEKNVQAA